jgi:hypothetical protein
MTADYTRLEAREGRRVTVRWVVPFTASPRFGTEQKIKGRLLRVSDTEVEILEGAHEQSRMDHPKVVCVRVLPSKAITDVVIHHEKERS